MRKYPLILQGDTRYCGLCCIEMVSDFLGKKILIEKINFSNDIKGLSLLDLKKIALGFGFDFLAFKINLEGLKKLSLPLIIHWYNKHFIVLYRIFNKCFIVADPILGIIEYSKSEFMKGWLGKLEKGVVISLAVNRDKH